MTLNRKKRSLVTVILCCIIAQLCSIADIKVVYAQSNYVTREEAIQMILYEMEIPYSTQQSDDYIRAAKEIGLIGEKTFIKYKTYIKKSEMAMLLVRADDYLYKKKYDTTLLKKIRACRISDLKKTRGVYQSYLIKSYALGYIVGNSNGRYSTDRTLNPNNKITRAYANQLVSMIKDKSKRNSISPDGQLIRKTNLPKMAEFYPYILASYPNSYYDWQFMFMRTMMNGKPIYGTSELKNKYDYVSPAELFEYKDGEKVFVEYSNSKKISSKELYRQCADKWEENSIKYLECVFNFDYRTTPKDKQWLNNLLEVDIYGMNARDKALSRIQDYIDFAKQNKTIVESKVIAVDKSSLYISNGILFMRVYVKYRVKSSKNLNSEWESPLIFTRFTSPKINNLVLGKWRECYANIQLSCTTPNYGIESFWLYDDIHDIKVGE